MKRVEDKVQENVKQTETEWGPREEPPHPDAVQRASYALFYLILALPRRGDYSPPHCVYGKDQREVAGPQLCGLQMQGACCESAPPVPKDAALWWAVSFLNTASELNVKKFAWIMICQ